MALWAYMKRRPLSLIICILTVISFGLYVRHGTFSGLAPLQNDVHRPPGKYWSSFTDVSTLFVFGDSWSSLGIKTCPLYEPTEAYHFGNPDFPGLTTANGPNWIGYLTHVFNRSAISTYDLAIPGSTVDNGIVTGFLDNDFIIALQQLVDPVLRCRYVPETWDPATSLFAIFFGMNDITACIELFQCDIYNPPLDELFKSYIESIAELHAAGARNFLLLNAPPISSAATLDRPSGDSLANAQHRATKLFNEHHRRLAHHLRTVFSDTTVFEFDVWGLFQKVYNDPQAVQETAVYKNVDDMCPTYGPFQWPDGKEVTQAEIDLCGGLRPEEYLWNSPSHVTWPFHKALARGVVEVMDTYG